MGYFSWQWKDKQITTTTTKTQLQKCSGVLLSNLIMQNAAKTLCFSASVGEGCLVHILYAFVTSVLSSYVCVCAHAHTLFEGLDTELTTMSVKRGGGW